MEEFVRDGLALHLGEEDCVVEVLQRIFAQILRDLGHVYLCEAERSIEAITDEDFFESRRIDVLIEELLLTARHVALFVDIDNDVTFFDFVSL